MMSGIERVFVVAMTAVLAPLGVALAYSVYDSMTADTFSLRKDAWSCTKNHSALRIQPAGKTIVAIPQTVCDQWTKSQ